MYTALHSLSSRKTKGVAKYLLWGAQKRRLGDQRDSGADSGDNMDVDYRNTIKIQNIPILKLTQ